MLCERSRRGLQTAPHYSSPMATGRSLGPRQPPHLSTSTGSRNILTNNLNSNNGYTCAAPVLSPRGFLSPLSPGQGQPSRSTLSPSLSSPDAVGSTDILPRPAKARSLYPYRDISSESSIASSAPSRRGSFGSDCFPSLDDRLGPRVTPFDESGTSSLVRSISDEDINTQTVARKYDITPSEGLLVYPGDVEKDDWLHNPDLNESDQEGCNIWNRRGLMNIGALAFLTLGVLALFVGVPVLCDFVRSYYHIVLTSRRALIRQHLPSPPAEDMHPSPGK